MPPPGDDSDPLADTAAATPGTDARRPPGFAELTPGAMIGEYRVERKLGEGGMGTVYAAVHPIIGKRAAIKILKLDPRSAPDAIDRFVGEARAVNQIRHPNIVDVFAFGDLPDGRSYFVMEQLEGETLGARIRRERLGVAEACTILDAITRALDAAHDKKIVHRDLKPDNIFLSTVGVKLLDFGIAKLIDDDGKVLDRTTSGTLMGTPRYISPEQARGEAIDPRADIYSLGVIAFELFTGRTPFDFNNAADLIASHLHDDAPAVRSRVDVPRALDAIIARMLAKDPAQRPSLAELRDVLAAVRQGASQTPFPEASPRRRYARIAIGCAIVIALGEVVNLAWKGDRTQPPHVDAVIAADAAPAMALLHLHISPAPETITVDGTPTPMPPGADMVISLEPRAHSITIYRPDYELFTIARTFSAGETSEQSITLEPLGADAAPAPAPTTGGITMHMTQVPDSLRVDDFAAPVQLDREMGMSGLSPGPHQITVTKKGYEPISRSVQVTAGQMADVSLTFVRLGEHHVAPPAPPPDAGVRQPDTAPPPPPPPPHHDAPPDAGDNDVIDPFHH